MDTAINLLTLVNIGLAVLLVVAGMARIDQRYAAQVRAEQKKKAILRGERRD